MLNLRMSLDDSFLASDLTETKFLSGESRAEAFDSPHIILSVSRYRELTVLWVGEDLDPFRSDMDGRPDPLNYRRFVDFEGIAVFLWRRESGLEIEVARTLTGTCPIYVTASGRVLTVSWRFEDVVLAADRPRPNIEACRLLLEHGTSQNRSTVIEGVDALWPGEAVIFDRTGLAFAGIEDPVVVVPGSIRENARVTDELMRIVETILRPRIMRSQSTIVELSGGYDSSLVAVAASNVRRPLNSYGLVHGGAMGAQQRNRRDELISLCSLVDVTHSSATPGPFEALESDECSLTPYDDIFRMACVTGLAQHPDKGIDLLLTGIGGDELTMNDTFYRREWELQGPSSLSTMAAAAGRCDMFMRRGIWVFQPFAHPQVVNFCRSLPDRLRSQRLLHVLSLTRAGLSDGYLFPRFHEHYGNLVQYEASQFDFEKALDGSIVADYGIQDYGLLLDQAYQAGSGGFSYELIAKLWWYLKLDKVLRRYVTS